jgi:hypothetical protein
MLPSSWNVRFARPCTKTDKTKCQILADSDLSDRALAENDPSRIDPLAVTALSAPRDAPLGTSGFSAAGKRAPATPRCQTPRRHVCVGTSCGRNVIKWPASVREERVLCKSILSPQREPMDESIIRRVKSPMLPKFRCCFRQILPVRKKFPKSFPASGPRSFGLAGRPLGVLPAIATLLGQGLWSDIAATTGSRIRTFEFPPGSSPAAPSLLLGNYSRVYCARSIAFLKLRQRQRIIKPAISGGTGGMPKGQQKRAEDFFGVVVPFFTPQKSQKSPLAGLPRE